MSLPRLHLHLENLSRLARLARTPETQAFYEARCILAIRSILRARRAL